MHIPPTFIDRRFLAVSGTEEERPVKRASCQDGRISAKPVELVTDANFSLLARSWSA